MKDRGPLLRQLRWHATRRSNLQLEILLEGLLREAEKASPLVLEELLSLFLLDDGTLLDILLGRCPPPEDLSLETIQLLKVRP